MFQAVLPGCILINFFIYDPLLYFLKKLAGAKNLLDLHALGRVSNVRYTQECIKMKRSQSLQSGQAPTRVVLGSRAALWVISEPGSAPARGSRWAHLQLPLPQACSVVPLELQVGGGALGPLGGPDWTGKRPAARGASRALLSFPGHPQWHLNSTSLSLSSLSPGSTFGGYALFRLCFPRGKPASLTSLQTPEGRSRVLASSRSLCSVSPAALYRTHVSESGPASRLRRLWKGTYKAWFSHSGSCRLGGAGRVGTQRYLPSLVKDRESMREGASVTLFSHMPIVLKSDLGLRGGCLWLAVVLGGPVRGRWGAGQPALSAWSTQFSLKSPCTLLVVLEL